eukprot:145695_1
MAYRTNCAINIAYGIGAYFTTHKIQTKYGKWRKLSSLIAPVSILGRCVTAGFVCIGVSSWLCSYYCKATKLRQNDDDKQRIAKRHIFALKSSVLLFSITTYYCVGLFSHLEFKEIDIPDIELDLDIVEISAEKFVVTGSVLASIM